MSGASGSRLRIDPLGDKPVPLSKAMLEKVIETNQEANLQSADAVYQVDSKTGAKTKFPEKRMPSLVRPKQKMRAPKAPAAPPPAKLLKIATEGEPEPLAGELQDLIDDPAQQTKPAQLPREKGWLYKQHLARIASDANQQGRQADTPSFVPKAKACPPVKRAANEADLPEKPAKRVAIAKRRPKERASTPAVQGSLSAENEADLPKKPAKRVAIAKRYPKERASTPAVQGSLSAENEADLPKKPAKRVAIVKHYPKERASTPAAQSSLSATKCKPTMPAGKPPPHILEGKRDRPEKYFTLPQGAQAPAVENQIAVQMRGCLSKIIN